uniref:Somatostatin 1, tandem duplicate 1 n=1 Tax=Sinocyclocheilus grahami TaxID=75366 RepID=A0A672LCC6_SINGR
MRKQAIIKKKRKKKTSYNLGCTKDLIAPSLCTFFLRVSTLSNAPSATSIYTLADLLSDLVQAENEALEPEDLSRAVEKDDVRLELERAAGPMLAPRERKAGCKNFFWKTFTSC